MGYHVAPLLVCSTPRKIRDAGCKVKSHNLKMLTFLEQIVDNDKALHYLPAIESRKDSMKPDLKTMPRKGRKAKYPWNDIRIGGLFTAYAPLYSCVKHRNASHKNERWIAYKVGRTYVARRQA
jgi:hypothetical protein